MIQTSKFLDKHYQEMWLLSELRESQVTKSFTDFFTVIVSFLITFHKIRCRPDLGQVFPPDQKYNEEHRPHTAIYIYVVDLIHIHQPPQHYLSQLKVYVARKGWGWRRGLTLFFVIFKFCSQFHILNTLLIL
jgi:hypothetical protein